jgi:hypothetical protein
MSWLERSIRKPIEKAVRICIAESLLPPLFNHLMTGGKRANPIKHSCKIKLKDVAL